MDFKKIAYRERRNGLIFKAMAEAEANLGFREILKQLAEMEVGHFEFWKRLVGPGDYNVQSSTIIFFRALRRIFGITFVVRLLEMQEDKMIDELRLFLFSSNHPDKPDIEHVILVEEAKEQKLIKQISEERIQYTGSIVLGLNDGLIELSGALTGFTFAFQHSATVTLAGFILGISASLSMASSAYLQARHDRSKDPQKSAIYTGIAYLTVVLLLIAPFLLIPHIYISLTTMLVTVFTIVAGLSFYTAVVFNRKFKDSFKEMLVFSVGTALVTFLIGSAARKFFGIQL